jgi:hypothetical protein
MNRFKKPAITILLFSIVVLTLSVFSAASAVWGS